MSDRGTVRTHPTYGMVRFSRRTGHTGPLYGSPLADHPTSISLTIERSSIRHDLGQNWHYCENELIEIVLSPGQFADLLTNMNTAGVPCTVTHVKGERIDPMPADEPVEHEEVVREFKKDTAETSRKLREGLKTLKTLLAKPKLTRADKDDIAWLVEKALQDVEANAPFMLEQFGEASEKMMSAAKAEVAAAGQAVIERLGMQKLAELQRQASMEYQPTERQSPFAYLDEPKP